MGIPAYTYHSPDGNRTLFADKVNADKTVDLVNENGGLEIGSCKVEAREGGCTPHSIQSDSEPVSLDTKKVDELRAIAENLGIDHSGLKKADLAEVIKTKQADSEPVE